MYADNCVIDLTTEPDSLDDPARFDDVFEDGAFEDYLERKYLTFYTHAQEYLLIYLAIGMKNERATQRPGIVVDSNSEDDTMFLQDDDYSSFTLDHVEESSTTRTYTDICSEQETTDNEDDEDINNRHVAIRDAAAITYNNSVHAIQKR